MLENAHINLSKISLNGNEKTYTRQQNQYKKEELEQIIILTIIIIIINDNNNKTVVARRSYPKLIVRDTSYNK